MLPDNKTYIELERVWFIYVFVTKDLLWIRVMPSEPGRSCSRKGGVLVELRLGRLSSTQSLAGNINEPEK